MADGRTPARGNRSQAAVALRLAGASYAEVADVLEYADARTARHEVEDVLAASAADPADRETLRREALGRLERLLRATWAKATTPDHPEHIPAAKFALSVVDRVIRLQGLDAPAELVVHTPTMREIDAWVATVTAVDVEDLRALEDRSIIDVEAEPDDLAG
ncbi:MAG TPA: hypothetical protein VFK70_00980 [Vicinamibacteria bacterium]|nr:hypothetical protein [Vicinamibacteria bacterium]